LLTAPVEWSDFGSGRNFRSLPHFSLRVLKQKGAGDQRSQNMCEKSSQNHILNLDPKKPFQNKFELFDTTGPSFTRVHKGQLKLYVTSTVPCMPLHQQIKHNQRKVDGFAGIGQ